MIRRDASGQWKLRLPYDFATAKHPVACMNVDEYGLWVRAVLENEQVREDPRPILATSDELSFVQVLEQLSKGESWHCN